ncbi:hypothetical protein SAMN05216331_13418 [Porphyromonadaceae bacterium KH3R12]|nr:hypothetical protein SAMN05216331_13418 [Porphyromonadaceae bacterium KH3R12]
MCDAKGALVDSAGFVLLYKTKLQNPEGVYNHNK